MRVASSMGDEAGNWEKIVFDKSSEFREESRQSLKNLIPGCATQACSIVRRKAAAAFGCWVYDLIVAGLRQKREVKMLETIAIILVILWLLGFVSSYTMGGFIHVLLVVAIVVILIRVIQGRRPL